MRHSLQQWSGKAQYYIRSSEEVSSIDLNRHVIQPIPGQELPQAFNSQQKRIIFIIFWIRKILHFFYNFMRL